MYDPYFHNPHGQDQEVRTPEHSWEIKDSGGWHFGAGDPEFWKFQDAMLVPGGRILDVGIGHGRSSLFFALHGMSVTGYETIPSTAAHTTGLYEKLKNEFPEISCAVLDQDFMEAEVEEEAFDTVLLAHTLHHVPSKREGYRIIDKAWQALKPAGTIWIRAAGKMDQSYWGMRQDAWRYPGQIRIVDNDVIEHPCTCSGEYKIEPSLFFDQMDLLRYMAAVKGGRVLHNRMIPQEDRHNIMFGEDFNRENGNNIWYSGTLTILAQKPAKVC